ncbi:winged helix-turn-helix transcriptional regulator [Isosphaera pallida]|uniref:winged helix-turn-helix transcriptional regulator n=1 Tax=Isosphaera pallida TaxID=128 RepID=UPI0009D688FE
MRTRSATGGRINSIILTQSLQRPKRPSQFRSIVGTISIATNTQRLRSLNRDVAITRSKPRPSVPSEWKWSAANEADAH